MQPLEWILLKGCALIGSSLVYKYYTWVEVTNTLAYLLYETITAYSKAPRSVKKYSFAH
jgi:hypothetical protein